VPLVKWGGASGPGAGPGTFPAGSEWARVPFPECADPNTGFGDTCKQLEYPEVRCGAVRCGAYPLPYYRTTNLT
jgi:hypothetical protein